MRRCLQPPHVPTRRRWHRVSLRDEDRLSGRCSENVEQFIPSAYGRPIPWFQFVCQQQLICSSSSSGQKAAGMIHGSPERRRLLRRRCLNAHPLRPLADRGGSDCRDRSNQTFACGQMVREAAARLADDPVDRPPPALRIRDAHWARYFTVKSSLFRGLLSCARCRE